MTYKIQRVTLDIGSHDINGEAFELLIQLLEEAEDVDLIDYTNPKDLFQSNLPSSVEIIPTEQAHPSTENVLDSVFAAMDSETLKRIDSEVDVEKVRSIKRRIEDIREVTQKADDHASSAIHELLVESGHA